MPPPSSYLTEKELEEFREIFSLVDTDNRGRISRDEFRRLMFTLRLQPTEEELQEMFQEVDIRNSTFHRINMDSVSMASRGNASPGGSIGNYSLSQNNRTQIGAFSGVGMKSSELNGISSNVASSHNQDDGIDFETFVSIMSKRVQSEYTPEQLRSAFKLFETDHAPSGFVHTHVLQHALTTYGSEKLSEDDAKRLLASIDPKGTGLINYIEFVSMVSGDRSSAK